jgi:hypothetical protein
VASAIALCHREENGAAPRRSMQPGQRSLQRISQRMSKVKIIILNRNQCVISMKYSSSMAGYKCGVAKLA